MRFIYEVNGHGFRATRVTLQQQRTTATRNFAKEKMRLHSIVGGGKIPEQSSIVSTVFHRRGLRNFANAEPVNRRGRESSGAQTRRQCIGQRSNNGKPHC